MKKLMKFAAVVAIAISSVACGSNLSSSVDSLSYAVGAQLGLGLNLNMGDFDLDEAAIRNNIRDFYENGDPQGEEYMELRNQMMQYQYTVIMPYMYAKYSRDRIQTDMPDTLPALPEVFNEEFTRERVSEMFGKDMGAMVKGLEIDVKWNQLYRAMDDAQKVENPAQIDSLMLMTEAQMQGVIERHFMRLEAEAAAEAARIAEENAVASAEWLAEIEKMEGVQKTESGLLYRIDREGDGAQPTADTDVVTVNYEGKVRDGQIFDSSYERNEPVSFPLNGVIAGWTEGLKLVKVGGQITLWIPAELAYGESARGEIITPNSALEFKVELLEVNPAE
jgi:FKBP-type peptidyl-prolyl cis-trans isomerase FkpA